MLEKVMKKKSDLSVRIISGFEMEWTPSIDFTIPFCLYQWRTQDLISVNTLSICKDNFFL